MGATKWKISEVLYENSAWVYRLRTQDAVWKEHDGLVAEVELRKDTGQSRPIGVYPE